MKRLAMCIICVICLVMSGCNGERPESGNPSTTVPPHQPDEPKVQWYALGDSITQGYYSYFDDEGKSHLRLSEKRCWAQLVADKKGWELTNLGMGGASYVHEGTVLQKTNARDYVDTIDFRGADLVTLAYGVNDWKYSMPLGSMEDDIATGGTLYSNMRYCIEKILADEPLAKIVVISPINCSRYGTEEGNWGIGYSFEENDTLEDICAAEEEICAYYGVEFVDMLHESVVNRKNAPMLLPDGVHPSLETHAQMAAELSSKINYS